MRGENIVADTNYFGSILDKIAIDYINKKSNIYPQEVDIPVVEAPPLESIKVSSKQELVKLGYRALGVGIYKDSEHHLWTLKREGDGYCLERSEDEESIRKAKESSIANKKSENINYGPIVFKDTEGDWTAKVQKNRDYDVWTVRWFHKEKGEDDAKSYEADTREEAIENASHELKRLKEGLTLSFSGSKVSSKITIKSDSPLQPFLNDLSQSGIYYQKLSETVEDSKHLAILDVDDNEKASFMSMASDSGIIVEAKQLISTQEAWDMSPRRFRYKLIEGLVENIDTYIAKNFEDLPAELQSGITENYNKLSKTGNIIASILESEKVFSDEAVYSAIKHYLNMGFNVKDSIDTFMKSYNLDKKYEEPVKDLVEKYNLK